MSGRKRRVENICTRTQRHAANKFFACSVRPPWAMAQQESATLAAGGLTVSWMDHAVGSCCTGPAAGVSLVMFAITVDASMP